MSWASRPALHAQPPDSGKRVTFKENNPMRLYFKHLHPSPLPSGPKNPAPSATMQTESRQENHLGGGKKINAIPPRESWKQRMGATKVAKVATSEVARVSRRAVSPFIPTPKSDVAGEGDISLRLVSAAWSKAPASLLPSRSGRVKTRESNEIAPVMWGVVTRVRPAPSTQTIENKRTVLRHRPRNPRKTQITPYM